MTRKYFEQRGPIYSVGKGYAKSYPEARKRTWVGVALDSSCACHRPKGFEGQFNGVKKSIARLQMVRMHVRIP
jgi:hypothetical protein